MGIARSVDMNPADEMETNELIEAIVRMISWYQTKRSTVLAMSITDHIEQLACRGQQDLEEMAACDYKRLAGAWRYLASKR